LISRDRFWMCSSRFRGCSWGFAIRWSITWQSPVCDESFRGHLPPSPPLASVGHARLSSDRQPPKRSFHRWPFLFLTSTLILKSCGRFPLALDNAPVSPAVVTKSACCPEHSRRTVSRVGRKTDPFLVFPCKRTHCEFERSYFPPLVFHLSSPIPKNGQSDCVQTARLQPK